MARYHSYKNKSGGYLRGRGRYGRYYTVKSGCLLPVILFILFLLLITSYIIL